MGELVKQEHGGALYRPDKGETSNPHGRPLGSKNWKTIVQELADDETLADKLLDKKPAYWSHLKRRDAGHAIVAAMLVKASGGDYRAAKWLFRVGFAGEDYSQSSTTAPVFVDILGTTSEN